MQEAQASPTQINSETRSPSHSSLDYPEVLDPFLTKKNRMSFNKKKQVSRKGSGSSTRKKFIQEKHPIQVLESAP